MNIELQITPEMLKDAIIKACGGELYVGGEDWRAECTAVLRELVKLLS